MRLFKLLMNALVWLWAFLVPAALLGYGSYTLYSRSTSYLPLAVTLLFVGLILGFFFAEYVRKNYGLSQFFNRVNTTPKLDAEEHNN